MKDNSLELIIKAVASANDLADLLQRINDLDPIAAGNVYKTVLAILRDKNTTKTVFTFEELEKYGYVRPL
jgi:hypothetical protein